MEVKKVLGWLIGFVGVVFFWAAVVAGAPIAASVLALSFSAVVSWTTVQVLVGGVVGMFLVKYGFDHH